MRILALVTDAFGGEGGIAQANRDLLEAIAQSSPQNQIIILPRIANAMANSPLTGIRQESPIKNRPFYFLNSLWILWKNRPVHLIFCGHLFMAPFAAVLSFITGAPFWIHLHGIEAWKKPRLAVRLASENAALATAVSRFTRTKFLNWAKISPEKVYVLPDTVSEKFQPGPKPDYLLKRYALEGKKVMLTVGRLSKAERYKGHDKVISLIPRLIKNYPNLVYVIAGDGDDSQRLEAIAVKLDVSAHTLFIGRVNPSEIVDVYRMADLFVMPSKGEGFGIVFLEAAASGLPVIGGSKDGSVDAILGSQTGRIVDPGNSEDLFQAITQVLDLKIIPSGKTSSFSRPNFLAHTKAILDRQCSCSHST